MCAQMRFRYLTVLTGLVVMLREQIVARKRKCPLLAWVFAVTQELGLCHVGYGTQDGESPHR